MDEIFSPTAADRCDKCGARAYTRASKGDLSLLFCPHDRNKFYDSLLTDGWECVDDLESIDAMKLYITSPV